MWGESDFPQFSALFVVLIFIFLNLMTIPAAIDLFTGHHFIADSRQNKFILAAGGVAVSLAAYYLLVHGGKYQMTVREFSDEPARMRQIRLVLVWIYMIGSLALFFTLLALRDSYR